MSIPIATALNALISIIFMKYLAVNGLIEETELFVEFKVNLQFWINLLFLGSNYTIYHYRKKHEEYGFIFGYVLMLTFAIIAKYFGNLDNSVLIIALTYICVRLYATLETWRSSFTLLAFTLMFINSITVIHIIHEELLIPICILISIIFIIFCREKIFDKTVASTLNMAQTIRKDGVFVFGQGLIISYYTVVLIEYISSNSLGITVALSYQYFALTSMVIGVATTYLAPRIFQNDTEAVFTNLVFNVSVVFTCAMAFYLGDVYITSFLYDANLNHDMHNTMLIYFSLSLQLIWQPLLTSLNAKSNYFFSYILLVGLASMVLICSTLKVDLNIMLSSICITHVILCSLLYFNQRNQP